MPKTAIHPQYEETHVKCACGNEFDTRSTHKGAIVVEICSACHPFFTGKQKLVDTAGRIERFRRKFAATDAKKAEIAANDTNKREVTLAQHETERPLRSAEAFLLANTMPATPTEGGGPRGSLGEEVQISKQGL